jgi:hypothetical protein
VSVIFADCKEVTVAVATANSGVAFITVTYALSFASSVALQQKNDRISPNFDLHRIFRCRNTQVQPKHPDMENNLARDVRPGSISSIDQCTRI